MDEKHLLDYFKTFEKDGLYLHADEEHRMATINSLLENKKKYNSLACPCRLATGKPEDDADIACPCVYCKDDVEEFGACFCLLFVKEEYKDDPEFYPDIDDRRPADKIK